MPKSKPQKQNELSKLNEKIIKAKTIVLAGFNRLTMPESEQLRKLLKTDGGEILVSKKTFIARALKESGLEGANVREFEGQVATVFAYEDEIAPVKALDKFSAETEDKIVFFGGFLDGIFVDAQGMKTLAKIPAREELYARLAGSINAPVSGIVNVLAGTMRGFVCALKAIEEKKA
jgi:large subunit ribosomal protein L10